MKRNIIKFIFILILIVMIGSIITSTVSQAAFSDVDVEFVTKDAKDTSGAGKSVLNIIQSLLVVVQVAATGVAVIMLIVLAIKYMGSAPNDKASIKNSAIQYVVGAVVLFSAAGIIGIIRKFSGNVTATPSGGEEP